VARGDPDALDIRDNISADERVYGAISGKSEKHGYRLVRDIRRNKPSTYIEEIGATRSAIAYTTRSVLTAS
jgi:hypothetical protein